MNYNAKFTTIIRVQKSYTDNSQKRLHTLLYRGFPYEFLLNSAAESDKIQTGSTTEANETVLIIEVFQNLHFGKSGRLEHSGCFTAKSLIDFNDTET